MTANGAAGSNHARFKLTTSDRPVAPDYSRLRARPAAEAAEVRAAEEVEAAGLTHAVGYDGEGRVESLDATALIAALFVRVNDLEARLAALESR